MTRRSRFALSFLSLACLVAVGCKGPSAANIQLRKENQALIWAGSLFIIGQMIVIGALTRNVLQRRKAERALARAEG